MRDRGFRAALRFYRAHFRTIFVLSLVFYAAIFALVAVCIAELGVVTATLAAIYIVTASIFWQQAPLARLLDDARSNRPQAGIRRIFESLYPRMGSITGATALAALGLYVGFYLFVVPGLFLAARWALIVPVAVLEEKSAFKAFGRSNSLVRGHTWRVLAEFVVSALVMAVVWSFAYGFVAGGGPWVGGALAILFLALVTPPIPLMRVLSYSNLLAAQPAPLDGLPAT